MFPGCPASPADPSMFPPRVRRRRDTAERSVRQLFIQIVDHRFRHPTRCRPIAPRARIRMAAQFRVECAPDEHRGMAKAEISGNSDLTPDLLELRFVIDWLMSVGDRKSVV